MKYQEKCSCCEQVVVAYTHSLNKPLVSAFKAMTEKYLETKQMVKISEMGLTYNQIANWQKLQYFGLVWGDNTGFWYPTVAGLGFYYGENSILSPAATMRGKVIPDEHIAWNTHRGSRRSLFIKDIVEGEYKKRSDYADEKSLQDRLFDVPTVRKW